MPFRIYSNIDNKFQTMTPAMNLPIQNGVTIGDGALVRFAVDRIQLAPTTGDVAGVARIYDGVALLGNAAGTVTVDVDMLKPGDILQVEQGLMTDANTQAGDVLAIGAGSAILAVAGNADLHVVQRDAAANLVRVTVVNHQFQ